MDDSRAWRQALAILAGATILRLLLGAIVPLFPDETYYWEWSRALSPGYFDHPPLIALLIRAGTTLFGHTAFGVRFFPILAGTGAALAIALTARAMAGDGAARLATLVFACLPLATAGLVLATPDAPMLCAAAWTLFFVVRALSLSVASGKWQAPGTASTIGTRHRLAPWLAAGACIGLAMASKYTAILIPTAVALAFISHPRLQDAFGQRGPYLAVAVAVLVMLPVLWWNATHDWASFRFQLEHGLGNPRGGVLGAVNRELELLGGQLALVSPILFFLAADAVRRALDPTPDGVRLTLGVVSIGCFAFFALSATRHSVEANWPALAYLPAVVLLATEPPVSRRGVRWLNRGLALGAALSLMIVAHALFPILQVPAPRDPVAKAHGWNLAADKVEKRRAFITSRASFGRGDLHFAAERYQDASELAFHLADHPRVFALNLTGRPNQYDLWPTFAERAQPGAALLLVLDDEAREPLVIRRLSSYFQRIDQGESVALLRRGRVVATKRLWFLSGWNGEWPRKEPPPGQ